MKRLLKWVLILVVLAVVFSAVTYPAVTWWQELSAPKYLTAEVSHGRVETVVNSTGTIKPVRTVSVGAFTSGPVAKVNVDYNSVVTKGAVLAIIDDKLQRAAVNAGEAAVNSQEAAIASQQADLKRITALLEQ